MNIELSHSFLLYLHPDYSSLLNNCNKLSTYCNRLKTLSTKNQNRMDVELYKGMGFELFAEALIKLHPCDNRIGITTYSPLNTDSVDVGVDGIGIGNNGKPATVQVKFRSNSTHTLTANEDHLSNFVSASLLHYAVSPEDIHNMLVITNAAGLHYFTDNEMFRNKVRCLNYDNIKSMVNGNNIFWDSFRQLCDEYYESV